MSETKTPDLGGNLGIYQVPIGESYDTRVKRPPMFTVSRWEWLTEPQGYTYCENPLADGVETKFRVALVVVHHPGVNAYYPVLYLDESKLRIYTFGTEETEIGISEYSFEQGTGMIIFNEAPATGLNVYFEIKP